MDYSSLNTDVPIPFLSIVFWGIALVTFIGLVFLAFASRGPYRIPAGSGPILGTITIALIVSGLFVLGAAQVESQDADFHSRLASEYGLLTESSAYDVRNAASEGRTIVMSDETGTIDVQPRLDGENLTFYKVDKGVPINPRM